MKDWQDVPYDEPEQARLKVRAKAKRKVKRLTPEQKQHRALARFRDWMPPSDWWEDYGHPNESIIETSSAFHRYDDETRP